MKKLWKSLALLLCLLAGFGFVFTGCGDGDDDGNSSENDEKEVADGSVFWNFANNDLYTLYKGDDTETDVGASLQNDTGYIKGTSATKLIYVDASTAKVQKNGNSLNVQDGVRLEVPVSAGSVVTVIGYRNTNYYGYTLAGTRAENFVTQVTATTAGYIVVKGAQGESKGYIDSITVTGLKEEDEHEEPAEFEEVKQVGNTIGVLGVLISGSAEVSTADDAGITLKANIIGDPSETSAATEEESAVLETTTFTVTGDAASFHDADGKPAKTIAAVTAKSSDKVKSAEVALFALAEGEVTIKATVDGVASAPYVVKASVAEVTASVTGDSVTGIKNHNVSGTLTIEVNNDSFSEGVKSLAAEADASPYVSLTVADTVTIESLTVKTVSAKTITLDYTLKGAEVLAQGTIGAVLKAGALSYTTGQLVATGDIALVLTNSAVAVESVSLSSEAKNFVAGGSIDLAKLLTITPSNASVGTISYESSAPAVATVSDTGLVIVKSDAAKDATATITVTVTSQADEANGVQAADRQATFTVTVVENTVQLYNLYTATSTNDSTTVVTSEITSSSATDTTTKITNTNFTGYHASYGAYGSKGAYFTIPTTGADTTVIAYVTYSSATTNALTLSDDGDYAVERVTKGKASQIDAAKIDLNINGKGPQAFVWRYTGGKTSVKLSISEGGQVYITRIVVNNDPIPASVATTTYDFRKTSAYYAYVGSDDSAYKSTSDYTSVVSDENTSAKLYAFDAYSRKENDSILTQKQSNYAPLYYHGSDHGAATKTEAFLTFAVGGNCTITWNCGYSPKTWYLYDEAGNLLSSATPSSTGDETFSYTGDAGLVTVVLSAGTYARYIKVTAAAE